MTEDTITAHDLLDIVDRYFERIRREDLVKDDKAFERVEKASPKYAAWRARREEAWDRAVEWGEFLESLEPKLPEYVVHDIQMISMSSYEGEVVRRDAPAETDGVISRSLIVRVSHFAPIYEIYEFSTRIEDKPHASRRLYKDQRRTHDISPDFAPAAAVVGRAIEERYGFHRVGPEVLDIQLFNVTMWEDGWYTGTLGDALFSRYRF